MARATPVDLNGRRFGRWIVLNQLRRRLSGKRVTVQWLCRCDCGNERWIRNEALITGDSRSCGCLRNELVAARRQLRPHEALYRKMIRLGRGYSNEIDYERFIEYTKESQCHYCWQPLKWTTRYQLDRKDNSLGYSEANCVVCCFKCNQGKSSNYTYKEWWQMTAIYRRTGQLKIGDVVVHKSLGSQPLVVTGIDDELVYVRFGNPTQSHGTHFSEAEFLHEELETPVESIEREGEIFKTLSRKKNEVNAAVELSEPTSPSGIGHLN